MTAALGSALKPTDSRGGTVLNRSEQDAFTSPKAHWSGSALPELIWIPNSAEPWTQMVTNFFFP